MEDKVINKNLHDFQSHPVYGLVERIDISKTATVTHEFQTEIIYCQHIMKEIALDWFLRRKSVISGKIYIYDPWGYSLVVQCLGLYNYTAWGTDVIPDPETKIPQTEGHSQKRKWALRKISRWVGNKVKDWRERILMKKSARVGSCK